MALVPCPECQKEVSTEALACPQCAFPFPGKQAASGVRGISKLSACPDCRNPVSKRAHCCPHCGLFLLGDRNGIPEEESCGNQNKTWKCPICGTAHTRKTNGSESAARQEADRDVAPQGPWKSDVKAAKDSLLVITEPIGGPSASRRPVLWQDPPLTRKVEPHQRRYPRGNRKSILFVILVLILMVVAGGLGAIWQLEGVNPLEIALAYWRM